MRNVLWVSIDQWDTASTFHGTSCPVMIFFFDCICQKGISGSVPSENRGPTLRLEVWGMESVLLNFEQVFIFLYDRFIVRHQS